MTGRNFSYAYFVFPLRYRTPEKQCGLVATGDYQPSRSLSMADSDGNHVYWLITFDPRYKHQCREIENAIRDGVHFRLIIIKEGCAAGELRAREITGFNQDEYSEYAKLFKASLQDVMPRIDENTDWSLGVYVSDGLPSIPLLIIIRNETREVGVFSSFYLSEPIGRIPYLKWQSELKASESFRV